MSSDTSILSYNFPNVRRPYYRGIGSHSKGLYKLDYGINIPAVLLPVISTFPYYSYIPVNRRPVRGLGKNAFGVFRDSVGITPTIIQDERFFIGKGTIISPEGDFLIMTTINIPDEHSLVTLQETYSIREVNPKVHINRKLFSESFREKYRNLYNRVHNKIIPELADTDFDFNVKRDLDFSIKTTTDSTMDIEELNNFLKPFINDFQFINIVQ